MWPAMPPVVIEDCLQLISNKVMPLSPLILNEILRRALEPGVISLLMATNQSLDQVTSGHDKNLPNVKRTGSERLLEAWSSDCSRMTRQNKSGVMMNSPPHAARWPRREDWPNTATAPPARPAWPSSSTTPASPTWPAPPSAVLLSQCSAHSDGRDVRVATASNSNPAQPLGRCPRPIALRG